MFFSMLVLTTDSIRDSRQIEQSEGLSCEFYANATMRNGDNNTPRNIDDGNPYSPSQGASLTRLYRICGFVFFISFGISVALYFHFRYADKSFELENIHTLSSSSSSMRPPTKTKTATTEEISKQNHVTESTSTRDDTFTCETTDGTTITMPRNVPDFLIVRLKGRWIRESNDVWRHLSHSFSFFIYMHII